VKRAPLNREAFLPALEGMLDSILSVRFADTNKDERALQLLNHEARRLQPRSALHSREDLIAALATLPDVGLLELRRRVLYYACHDLITILAHRHVRRDAIEREDAVLYVQDRLQRDDFRRIDAFDPAHGTSFRTYMWQVISRLLIDFRRSRSGGPQPHAADSADLVDGSADADAQLNEQQLGELVGALLRDDASDGANSMSALRSLLRKHLSLTSQERLFLKALFQHDMAIDEIRQLPGFRMTSGEAWRFYYRTLDRLLESFKDAGALTAMRNLIGASEPALTVSIDERTVKIEVRRILYVRQHDDESSHCHVQWQGQTVAALIRESFSRLQKTLAPWFTAVNATTLVADEQLAAAAGQWNSRHPPTLTLAAVPGEFPVGKNQLARLRRRFGEKNPAAESYNPPRVDSGD
jgi:DNA-directed RNA polymerase specialized sigma24 family protein